MIEIRYVRSEDKEFWYRLDKHLPEKEFENKVACQRGYVLLDDSEPIGLLRYNLVWDNTPFCTLLFVDWKYQGKGYGKKSLKQCKNRRHPEKGATDTAAGTAAKKQYRTRHHPVSTANSSLKM